jgi:hypothetical protein
MIEPTNDNLLHETYRLTRENNEMLHRMRRSALLWGFIKFLLYAAFLLAPIWFYVTYLNGTVENLIQTVNKIEGVNTQAQNQLQGFEVAWQQLQARMGASTSTPH